MTGALIGAALYAMIGIGTAAAFDYEIRTRSPDGDWRSGCRATGILLILGFWPLILAALATSALVEVVTGSLGGHSDG